MKFKEPETLKLKKSTSELKEAIISIGAILNKHGSGKLYFGVKDDGTSIGQSLGKDTLRDISKTISDHIEPKIYPDISPKKIAGKDCIIVKFQGLDMPYFAYGRAYIRIGNENKLLSIPELKRIITKKTGVFWEREISECKLKDTDKYVLKNYIVRANEAKRIAFKFAGVKNTLHKLNLLKGNKLLKAAEVLFCNDNSMEIQAAVFAGRDKLTFLDIRQFKGNIFSLREQAEIYIKEHMNWQAKLERSRREEIPEIPLRAISETIVNSLCHRDYIAPESNKIAIFKNRIEIYNPGSFPEGLTPEDYIFREEQSILRNPLIADVHYKSKDIEQWGSGLKRIYNECKDNNVKVEFKILKTGFMAVFYRKELPSAIVKSAGVEKRLVERLVEGLAENQKKILKSMHKNSTITKKELSEKIGISTTAIDKNISLLKKRGLLKRIGPDKGGYWEVISK